METRWNTEAWSLMQGEADSYSVPSPEERWKGEGLDAGRGHRTRLFLPCLLYPWSVDQVSSRGSLSIA